MAPKNKATEMYHIWKVEDLECIMDNGEYIVNVL